MVATKFATEGDSTICNGKDHAMCPNDKLIKARTLLLMDHPFYGVLSLRLQFVEAEWCDTLATDGECIYYNPKFVDELDVQETIFVVGHETHHNAMGHGWRGVGKEHDPWNMAADYSTNEILTKAKIGTMPKGALLEPTFYGLATEEVYATIMRQPPQQGQGKSGEQGHGGRSGSGGSSNESPQGSSSKQGGHQNKKQEQDKGKEQGGNGKDKKQPNTSDPGRCGCVLPPPKDKQKAQEQKAEWKVAVSQAYQATKGRGKLPGELVLQIEQVLDPPLPWHVLLRDFVERTARNDYSYRRPNPAYLQRGIIMPGILSEELPELVLAIDTSGSTIGYLSQFATHASDVLAAYKTTVRLLYCDAKVHSEEVYETADLPLKLRPIGGGGTSFKPVFEYVAEKEYTPACLIFFTDLDGWFPDKEPEYPTLWITPTNKKAPFGETVKYIPE